MIDWKEFLKYDKWTEFLAGYGLREPYAGTMILVVAILAVGLLAWLAKLMANQMIRWAVTLISTRSQLLWFEILAEEKVFRRLSHMVPAIVIQCLAPVLLAEWPGLVAAVGTGVNIYLICVAVMVLDGILNAILNGYEKRKSTGGLPLKGFIQAVKLIVYLVALILIASAFLGKEPFLLLSGFGALTAVLMLVFKDAILGFVAGIQLSANDMVNKGDWIEMPKQLANGFVIDVSLTTVKVQNWDKTITTIPSYLLISDSFRNWQGMFESGGRRIKRSIMIDMKTIRFVDAEILNRAKQSHLLRPYLERVLAEIQDFNEDRKLEIDDLLNGRRLTNIGIFRNYCAAYLRNHPKLNQDLIQIARQLAPNEHGIPLEFYCFTSDVGWVAHEAVQADIFDHMLAILPHFGLRVFQAPSGRDIEELATAMGRTSLHEMEKTHDI